ncbi:unnamed protein product [Arabidopsis arenosa]|uniref:Transposase-associated domain-containing protein n=1 Tax=Arabidopsis arenosa TaxID=38785 RepID=A0A8S1ZH72_ARAAE|nr:unnamed protein product [Arabidopsis arenosa]
MDKAWVWLPRNSLEYEEGATKFVLDATSCLGNVLAMFCPCVDCRNVVHQSNETVLEHLVIRGMDLKYKRSKCWSKHGEISDKTADVHASENEAYDLFRTAFMESEGKQSSQQNNVEESETVERLILLVCSVMNYRNQKPFVVHMSLLKGILVKPHLKTSYSTVLYYSQAPHGQDIGKGSFVSVKIYIPDYRLLHMERKKQ